MPVEADDILVLASDGLSDNLWDEDILDEVVRFRRSFMAAPPPPGAAPAPGNAGAGAGAGEAEAGAGAGRGEVQQGSLREREDREARRLRSVRLAALAPLYDGWLVKQGAPLLRFLAVLLSFVRDAFGGFFSFPFCYCPRLSSFALSLSARSPLFSRSRYAALV